MTEYVLTNPYYGLRRNELTKCVIKVNSSVIFYPKRTKLKKYKKKKTKT